MHKWYVDPASYSIPFRGKLIWTYNLIFVTFFLFLASLVVGNGIVPLKENVNIGPSPETLLLMGGIQGRRIQEGEWWRLFWGPYLHAGWLHLLTNLGAWWFIGTLIEPDWGFLRTFAVFNVSCITGGLLSAYMNPEVLSVGISGGVAGVGAGLIPYVIEYWDSIIRPVQIIFFTVISLFCIFLSGFLPSIDEYAHLGGMIGGLLLSFMTITRNGYMKSKKLSKKSSIKTILTKEPLDLSQGESEVRLDISSTKTPRIQLNAESGNSRKSINKNCISPVSICELHNLKLNPFSTSCQAIVPDIHADLELNTKQTSDALHNLNFSNSKSNLPLKCNRLNESYMHLSSLQNGSAVTAPKFRLEEGIFKVFPKRFTIRSVPCIYIYQDKVDWSSWSVWWIRIVFSLLEVMFITALCYNILKD